MPVFSVVIAVYNKSSYLRGTLDSVFAQTFTDFEVIIVNDGSTDDSENVILSYTDPRISYFKQSNQGAGAARNTAIDKANSPFIALLDADDYWYPYYLEEQFRLIQKYPEHQVFATHGEIEKAGKIRQKQYSLPILEKQDSAVNYFEASHLDSVLHSSSTVLKKEVLDIAGYYDPTIKSGQDTDLYIRIGMNFEIVFSSRICSRYHLRTTGLFKTTSRIEEKLDLGKYSFDDTNSPALKKFLDLNRYALAIQAKIIGDQKGYRKNMEAISKKNLNRKQRFLLQAPDQLVRILKKIKDFLDRKGIFLSVFK